jgi:hypothetical protein
LVFGTLLFSALRYAIYRYGNIAVERPVLMDGGKKEYLSLRAFLERFDNLCFLAAHDFGFNHDNGVVFYTFK